MKWQTHKKKIAYKSKWTTLREDEVTKPDGEKGIYNLIVAHPSVMIVPLTNDGIHLIKVWRYPTKEYSWELPGGRTDGEKPHFTAKKELQEETGLVAKKWVEVGSFYPLNGLSNELCYVFVAKDLTQTGEDEKSDDAISDTTQVSLSKAEQMIKMGKIQDGQTISALTLAKLHLNKDL